MNNEDKSVTVRPCSHPYDIVLIAKKPEHELTKEDRQMLAEYYEKWNPLNLPSNSDMWKRFLVATNELNIFVTDAALDLPKETRAMLEIQNETLENFKNYYRHDFIERMSMKGRITDPDLLSSLLLSDIIGDMNYIEDTVSTEDVNGFDDDVEGLLESVYQKLRMCIYLKRSGMQFAHEKSYWGNGFDTFKEALYSMAEIQDLEEDGNKSMSISFDEKTGKFKLHAGENKTMVYFSGYLAETQSKILALEEVKNVSR